MNKKVIMFDEIANEVMEVRGNKWNSKKHIDVTMLVDFAYANCKTYRASEEEIDEIACYLYEAGIKRPCIVAVRENDDDIWSILWGEEADIKSDGPVIFNARINRVCSHFNDISDVVKRIGEKECMLSWTHLDFDYEKEGWCAFYEEYELCNSVFHSSNAPMPAKTVAVSEVLKKYPTIEDLKKIPTVTEADLENGFTFYKPIDQEPCFIMVRDRMLCNSHSPRRLPCLFNAEGYEDDSYALHEEGDLFIREYEWDVDGGIGIRYNKGCLYDWR